MIFQQNKCKTVLGPLALSLAAVLLSAASISTAQAEAASDFTADVQKGLNAGQGAVVAGIQTQDYKTSWDEFGTNVVVDGASAPADIEKSLDDDIVSSLQAELKYNQKDEQYLRLRHSSPEEIQAVEGDGGNDLLPQDAIDPNPSLEANPDVNPSALDVPASSMDISGILLEPDTEPALPDTMAPPQGDWKPSEIKVFETILNNTEAPSADPAPAEPSPDAVPSAPLPDADVPPPADAPAN